MSADPNNCKLVLSLHRFGREPVQIAIGLGPEFRMVDKDSMMLGPLPLVGMKDAVTMLKERQITLDMVKMAAIQLGGQLADYLLDEGGWSGEDRRQTTKDYPKRGDWPL